MKEYYLRLVAEDFTAEGDNAFLSCVVDLYDNESPESEVATPSYRNYSVRKSNYGLDLLGDSTWVGMELATPDQATPGDPYQFATPTSTDIGKIWLDRFVDESGRIDLSDWYVDYANPPGNDNVGYRLDVYHTDSLNYNFPDEWASQLDIYENIGIRIIRSFRYVRFRVKFDTDQIVNDPDFELWVRITIGHPLQAPFYKESQDLLDLFPEWMDLRDPSNRNHATPALATPDSVGAQFVNATLGEWLSDLRIQNNWTAMQLFLATASITQMDWVWEVSDVPSQVFRVEGDGTELARVSKFSDFWTTDATQDVFYWVRETRSIYTRKHYDSIVINYEDVTYEQDPYHIWNYFDEYGLVMDLPRHHLEDNETYRARLFDVYRNKPGVGREAFKLALRRELNLWESFGAIPLEIPTPDSDYQGATPETLEFSDLEKDSQYMYSDGLPTQKFIDLVEELSKKYPTTWGYIRSGEALWDPGGRDHEGYSVLPYRLDATPLDDGYVQSGVGDGEDLYLHRPEVVNGPREFEAKLKIRGREASSRTEYRRIYGSVLVSGRADREIYDNPTTTEWFTVEVITDEATPQTYYHSFQISAKNNTDLGTLSATPSDDSSSWEDYMFLDASGVPFEGHIWYDENGNEIVIPPEVNPETGVANDPIFIRVHEDYADDLTIPRLGDMELHPGRLNPDTWNPLSPSFEDAPSSDTYEAWFSGYTSLDGSTTLEYGGPSSLAAFDKDSGNPAESSVTMRSKQISSAPGTWTSEPVRVRFEINGVAPDQTTQSYTMPMPEVLFDLWVDGGTEEYVVEFEEAYFENEDGDIVNLDSSYIYLDGSNSWSSEQQIFTYSSTDSIVVSSGSGGLYPISATVWSLFEAEQITPFTGIVDENGPWRFGRPRPIGNTNYYLTTLELDRDDFGLAHSSDYVVTWIGVDVVYGDRVGVWLDTNVVKPAVDDGTSITYPSGSIEESEDGGVYSFSPIIVKARLEPGPSADWNPQINSGFFYDRNQEYYLYADLAEHSSTPASTIVLDGLARQGAPVIVEHTSPIDEATPSFRQVAFWDSATPWDSLVDSDFLLAKEVVKGNGTTSLYVAYEDIYGIRVTNLTTGVDVTSDTETSSNIVEVSETTSWDHDYQVEYRIVNSFYVDNDWVFTDSTPRTQRTRLVFDDVPSTPLSIWYENSAFNPATPIDVPLHPFYTIHNEGFVYLSHNEYDLDIEKTQVRLSPATVVADGEDYMLLSILALDENGNPKPNVVFGVSTDWGTPDVSSVTTNNDGFATTIIYGESATPTHTATPGGTVYVTHDSGTPTVDFDVTPLPVRGYRLLAIPGTAEIPANGLAQQWVFGIVQDNNLNPVPHAYVDWRKGRYVKEVFDISKSTSSATPGVDGYAGQVIADENGRFEVGPFTATPFDPGLWFVSVESDSASPSGEWVVAGDMVSWIEYYPSQYGQEIPDGVPHPYTQNATPASLQEWLYNGEGWAFPVTYTDDDLHAPATPSVYHATPPSWWGIDKYTQYQLGILGGATPNSTLSSGLDNAYPDYKDL